jgi:hypothetical protein
MGMDDFLYCLLLARRRVKLLECTSAHERRLNLQAIRKLRLRRDLQRSQR